MPPLQHPPGVEGILGLTQLPDPAWRDRWDRIIVPEAIKDRLLNYLLLSLRHRRRISSIRIPLHGLVVLSGPPGTGKTTLAGGLADRAARELGGDPLLFVDIDPHAFPSQMLGESQRSVARLFNRTLPDLAQRGWPTLVLLDEVEALAVGRAGASLETNPVDVHRATDAMLSGLDHVAANHPNVTFIATTNLASGVDTAFLSRADLVEEISLPGEEAVTAILADALDELTGAGDSPGLVSSGSMPENGSRWPIEELRAVAVACVSAEMDARQVRKLVVRAACSSRELSLDPSGITLADLLRTAVSHTEENGTVPVPA